MLFRKRRKPDDDDPPGPSYEEEMRAKAIYPIEFDMMVKGSIGERNGVPIRQFGVYVDGVVRLVTSGDRVDKETYDALLAVGAIVPSPTPRAAEDAGAKDEGGDAGKEPGRND